MISPGLCGDHGHGKESFGHSVIIDPWGEILADGGTDIGIVTAKIDMNKVTEARQRIPAMSHDKPFKITSVN